MRMDTVCQNCGTRNRSAAKFCMECIAPMASTPDNAAIERTLRVPPTRDAGMATTFEPSASPDVLTSDFLPVDTLVEGFRIVRVIGEGGFGIVYLAWDVALERHVAIKEYMPLSLCMRGTSSLDVTTRSERDREIFDVGLRSFVNEARLLARFDHPALVKVLRFWEGHRTAYMAMPYYEGPTLKASLAAMGGPPSEAQLRSWLRPLLNALALIHGEQCYHRDIAPDNILLTPTGPLLLDFGAARRVISDRTQALTTMLKPGFAPIEQYGGTQLQGPWTDLYAVGGVVHYAITGRAPVAAVVRVVEDLQPALSKTWAGRYSDEFLRAIDAVLAVRPEGRPQDVAQFLALLGEEPAPAAVDAAPVAVAVVESTAPEPVASAFGGLSDAPAARRSVRWTPIAGGLALALCAGLWWSLRSAPLPTSTPAPAPAPASAAAPAPAPAPASATIVPATVSVPAPIDTAPAEPTPAAPAVVVTPAIATPVPAPAPTPVAIAKPRAERIPKPPVASAPVSAPSASPPVDRSVEERADSSPSYVEKRRAPRCAELVLKASLEPLNPDDIAYLRSTCK